MPSRRVPLVEGCSYHVYNKVADDLQLFYSKSNYLFFLNLWQEIDFTPCCRLLAYCLMPTHYHFLVTITDPDSFSKKMSYLFNKYLKTLESVLGNTGRYFENRFQNILIDDASYLFRLCCYIHMNPVKAGLVNSLEEWPYSNYLEFVGKGDGKMWDPDFFFSHFDNYSDYEEMIKNIYSETGLDSFLFDE
jgi:REP element-mobilizing transposase RayT